MCRITAITACFFAFACAGKPQAQPAELSAADARKACTAYLQRGACDDAVTACVAARADGDCEECDDNLRTAIQCNDRGGTASDTDPEMRYRLAQYFEKRELIDDALTAYGEAVRFSKGSYKPALFGFARLAEKLGRKDDVADACQHFIDGSPDDELGDARSWCVSHLRGARR